PALPCRAGESGACDSVELVEDESLLWAIKATAVATTKAATKARPAVTAQRRTSIRETRRGGRRGRGGALLLRRAGMGRGLVARGRAEGSGSDGWTGGCRRATGSVSGGSSGAPRPRAAAAADSSCQSPDHRCLGEVMAAGTVGAICKKGRR